MKFNKKILEAVSIGIQLALDDFEDNEPNSSISHYNDVIDSEDVIKQRIELDKYTVDLGLPSRTRWLKYNLGCNIELLNKHPEDSKPEDWYGKYYAWGELEPIKVDFETRKCNPSCNWNNYKYAINKGYNSLTKYCSDPDYGYNGYTDNLTKLLPEDDIAYQTFQKYKSIHMPTIEQLIELINYTKHKYIENYKVNGKKIIGLNGMEFTGENGQKLFIPATGYCNDSELCAAGDNAFCWSSSLDLDHPCSAYYLDFCHGSVTPNSYYSRCRGRSIRPVFQN